MKKTLLLIHLILLFKISAFSQWNNYLYLSTYISQGLYGNFEDANFISPGSGMYAYSHWWSPSSGTSDWVKLTNDTGNSWITVYSNTDLGIGTYAIEVVRDQNTYFHIRNWQGITWIQKLTVGKSWINIPIGGLGFYNDFYAIDTSHIFLLYNSGSRRYIDKYENGIAAHRLDSFITEYPHIIFFPDSATGYVAASNAQNSKTHLILKSVTGGTNWINVFDDTLINIRKMFFISANVGFVTGDSGKIIKTIDGGSTWQYLNSGITINLNSIYFLNDSVGFAAGDSGKINRTTDGGILWKQDSTNTTASFKKIFLFGDSIGIAIAGASVYIINLNSLPPIWELYSNETHNLLFYPNPTSNALCIIIPAELLDENELLLKIIDCSGKIVQQNKSIIKENKIIVDLEQEAKGIYNVILSNGKKNYAGKIVFE